MEREALTRAKIIFHKKYGNDRKESWKLINKLKKEILSEMQSKSVTNFISKFEEEYRIKEECFFTNPNR